MCIKHIAMGETVMEMAGNHDNPFTAKYHSLIYCNVTAAKADMVIIWKHVC